MTDWQPEKDFPGDDIPERQFNVSVEVLERRLDRSEKRSQALGLLGAMLTLLMGGMTWHISQQNLQIRQEMAQQQADTRRAQLFTTIYEEVCDSGGDCQPKADKRAREEAVLAFARVELGHKETVNLQKANLAKLDLGLLQLSRANLSKADLSGADLSEAVLIGTDLRDADLRDADLSGVYLSEANLSGAYLSGADLSEANLIGADLSRTDLIGAHLSGADLSGADLRGAYLSEAYLSGANLIGADLTEAFLVPLETGPFGIDLFGQGLSLTVGDESTRLPEGIKRPETWSEPVGVQRERIKMALGPRVPST